MVKNSSRLRAAILGLKPWAYWRLSETADAAEGGVTARDHSGNNRTAEYRSTPEMAQPGLATGDPSPSLGYVEASKSYVKAVGILPFTGTKSFFAVVKRRTIHANNDAIFSSSQGSGNLILLYVPEGTTNIRLLTAGFAGTNATWTGAWPGDEAVHDIGLVVNPTTGKAILYVNGVSQGEKSVAAWGAEPKEIRLGHDGSTGGINATWAGWHQDIAVFDAALTAQNFADLHTARTTAPDPLSTLRYWGADMDGDVIAFGHADAPYDPTVIDDFEADAGREVGIVHYSDEWEAPGEGGLQWDGFGAGASLTVVNRGAIPMKSLGSDGPNIVARVLSGEQDDSIDQWATDAMAFGHPFFCRLWWEMNLTSGWNWLTTPAEYIEGWRYFVNRVRAIADNVTFVWIGNFVFTGAEAEKLASFYPGDDYVDWVGFNGYTGTNPVKSFGWRDPFVAYGLSHQLMGEIAPTKPIMISEWAASEFGGDKPAWLKKMLRGDAVDQMQRLRASVYFNWNIEHKPGERVDWQIESSPEAEAAFADGIASPLYSDPPYADGSPFVRPHATILPISPIVTVSSGPPAQTTDEDATFIFTADFEDATFEYRLDEGEWQATASPLTIGDLTERQHLLELRATDEDGFTGPVTAYSWRRPGTRVLQPGEVPKLRVPLQIVDGRLATVQQDSVDNIRACVYAVLSYGRGDRLEDLDFGVESRLFDQLPVDVDEWLEQIAAYEPRANVSTQQQVEEFVGLVLVEVGSV